MSQQLMLSAQQTADGDVQHQGLKTSSDLSLTNQLACPNQLSCINKVSGASQTSSSLLASHRWHLPGIVTLATGRISGRVAGGQLWG